MQYTHLPGWLQRVPCLLNDGIYTFIWTVTMSSVFAERWNILIYLDGYNYINKTYELGIFSLTILNQLL